MLVLIQERPFVSLCGRRHITIYVNTVQFETFSLETKVSCSCFVFFAPRLLTLLNLQDRRQVLYRMQDPRQVLYSAAVSV